MRYLALGSRGFPARGAGPAKPIWVRERTSRVLPIYALLLNLVVTLLTAALVFAVWVANRKRIAAETIGRAEEQALRTLKDPARDAETRKKEARLDAKEKAHELMMDTERQASHAKQAAVTLEQTLGRRESTLADRQRVIDRAEQELTTRDRALGEREKASAIAAAKYD